MQWKPHVTVAAIISTNDQFLLVEERINGDAVFNQPAGHLEYGETLLDAVKREVFEETAWQFEPEYLVGIYLIPGKGEITYIRFCFYGRCFDFDEKAELDREIIRTVWMTAAEIESTASRHRNALVSQCLNDYLAGKSCPLEILKYYRT